MSPHDKLMSDMVKMMRELEQYCEEFDPPYGEAVLDSMKHAVVYCSKFIDEEPTR